MNSNTERLLDFARKVSSSELMDLSLGSWDKQVTSEEEQLFEEKVQECSKDIGQVINECRGTLGSIVRPRCFSSAFVAMAFEKLLAIDATTCIRYLRLGVNFREALDALATPPIYSNTIKALQANEASAPLITAYLRDCKTFSEEYVSYVSPVKKASAAASRKKNQSSEGGNQRRSWANVKKHDFAQLKQKLRTTSIAYEALGMKIPKNGNALSERQAEHWTQEVSEDNEFAKLATAKRYNGRRQPACQHFKGDGQCLNGDRAGPSFSAPAHYFAHHTSLFCNLHCKGAMADWDLLGEKLTDKERALSCCVNCLRPFWAKHEKKGDEHGKYFEFYVYDQKLEIVLDDTVKPPVKAPFPSISPPQAFCSVCVQKHHVQEQNRDRKFDFNQEATAENDERLEKLRKEYEKTLAEKALKEKILAEGLASVNQEKDQSSGSTHGAGSDDSSSSSSDDEDNKRSEKPLPAKKGAKQQPQEVVAPMEVEESDLPKKMPSKKPATEPTPASSSGKSIAEKKKGAVETPKKAVETPKKSAIAPPVEKEWKPECSPEEAAKTARIFSQKDGNTVKCKSCKETIPANLIETHKCAKPATANSSATPTKPAPKVAAPPPSPVKDLKSPKKQQQPPETQPNIVIDLLGENGEPIDDPMEQEPKPAEKAKPAAQLKPVAQLRLPPKPAPVESKKRPSEDEDIDDEIEDADESSESEKKKPSAKKKKTEKSTTEKPTTEKATTAKKPPAEKKKKAPAEKKSATEKKAAKEKPAEPKKKKKKTEQEQVKTMPKKEEVDSYDVDIMEHLRLSALNPTKDVTPSQPVHEIDGLRVRGDTGAIEFIVPGSKEWQPFNGMIPTKEALDSFFNDFINHVQTKECLGVHVDDPEKDIIFKAATRRPTYDPMFSKIRPDVLQSIYDSYRITFEEFDKPRRPHPTLQADADITAVPSNARYYLLEFLETLQEKTGPLAFK